MIQLFAGYDLRESIGYHAFCQSVIDTCSEPVSIAPLSLKQLEKFYQAGQRDGTNEFIYSRFLVPYLMGYKGWAIFVDGADMIVKGDLAELYAMRNGNMAVQVVKHNYKTKNPRKYVGTGMEARNDDYPMKNASSVMLINCGHPAWAKVTPDFVAEQPGSVLHRFAFMDDVLVGDLPIEWNWLSQEHGVNEQAKLVHFSIGVPGFTHYNECDMSNDWHIAHHRMNWACNDKDEHPPAAWKNYVPAVY